MNTIFLLFVIPGIILAYIIYLLLGHYFHKRKNKKPDIIDILEAELKRLKEDDD